MSASLSVAFSWTGKIFNFRERLGLGDFFCFFSAFVIIQLADARLFWCEGKGKDRQAPERNWTCSYTTTGSWQRLGKRLGSPGEAWSQSQAELCQALKQTRSAPSLVYLRPRPRYPTPLNNH